ncbi:predicted protein [Postia placenta Mad-698-R]|uniref:Uncharacterized protein n=1 Tax=Postia placenta MAD-698-R-SB12 TaxID=670580 RepID=A0A1X6N0J6_9APHY|nr:hypothetical protein POSPLADRAFT_1066048 [Postia placenta MAD-698-R-SB12]EED82735.1 predicted protein [Postia placenta Mad-698-R]OSX62022.1 hypothetical protein POSPLADRAFT_1066048 [Postia placenta MAD-698-R-SB12]
MTRLLPPHAFSNVPRVFCPPVPARSATSAQTSMAPAASHTPFPATPSCPFCRVPFTSDGVRLIRVDFPSAGAGAAHSGYSTPTSAARRALSPMPTPAVDADDDVLLYSPGRDREHPLSLSARSEAKLLEHRVAKVATKKCSVEEVVTLQRELQDWLRADGKHDDQAALKLSAALLRAIILNHTAHTQATEHAKSVEAALKEKLDEVQAAKDQLEAELRREREREREKEKERLRERERAHHQLIQRWMPTIDAAASSPPHSKLAAWPPALRQKTPAPSPRA